VVGLLAATGLARNMAAKRRLRKERAVERVFYGHRRQPGTLAGSDTLRSVDCQQKGHQTISVRSRCIHDAHTDTVSLSTTQDVFERHRRFQADMRHGKRVVAQRFILLHSNLHRRL